MAKKILKKKKSVKKVIKKTAHKKPVAKKTAVKKAAVKKGATAKSKVKKTVTTFQPVVKSIPQKINMDYSKAVSPLGDRLVIRLTKTETKTAGGLYIPDTANTAVGHLKGEVLAVGQGHTTKKGFLREMDVQKGDCILFSDNAATKVIFNSEELFIVNETDVLGIIQK